MIDEVPSLARLIRTLQQVPYLASRNLYRVASHFLEMDQDRVAQFCHVLQSTHDNLVTCDICFFWKEKEGACSFCSDGKRDQKLVCVVEMWYEVLSIERTRAYGGVYHVLGGSIYPLEGVGPDDLKIAELLKRVDTGITELILATGQTPEGEATASFIASKVKHLPVKISCLARGMPVGSSIGSMDRLTIHKALSERRPF